MATPPTNRPIVLVSNRGPLTFEQDGDGSLLARRGAGGLVSGLAPIATDPHVTWLAAAMSAGDRRAAAGGVVEAEGYRVRMLALDEETYRLAYDVVSNETLWFAHHGLWDLTREPAFERSWDDAWQAYRAVNDAFADAVAEVADDDALVLIQDYQLCLVGARLRAVRPELSVVHFSHTPFAPPSWLAALPDTVTRELLEGMAVHRACGFHTSRWADDFSSSARALAGVDPPTFVSPMASDPSDIRRAAASPECQRSLTELEAAVGDRRVIGRVDRMELSKNLVRGFRSYDDLLARHPEHRERVVFVASAYPTRQGVAAYRTYREEVERTVDEVNERWGTATWQPILLDVEDDFPRSLALLRRSDVLLVNPIRDGLNLVASEGTLVNERDAVLCLSPEAGAWERLGSAAVRTPPFDLAGTAEALHIALTMPPDERQKRADELRTLSEARTPRHWLADQLTAAQ